MSVYVSQQFTWARAILDAALAALSARPAAALLTTPTLVLITDNNPITADDAVANHTLANFSGYGAQAVTLAGPGNVGDTAVAALGHALFLATTASPFVSNQVTGYLLTDGVTAFYGGEMFPSMIGIAAAGDFLDLELIAPMAFTVPAS